MGLHHFRNSTASREKYEPVVTSYSDATIILPSQLGQNNLFIEHISKISGLDNLYPTSPVIKQQFYQSTRSYAGLPTETSVELTIDMTQNLNRQHENYIYNTILEWYRMIYDERTAQTSLKIDYCGSLIVQQYDRDGSIWRNIFCEICFPTGQPTGMGDFDTKPNNSAADLQFKLQCDLNTIETKGIDF